MKYPVLALSASLALSPPLTAMAEGYVTPSPAQISIIRTAHCSLTQVVDAPIYDADGYSVKGQLNECSQDRPWLDVTTGAGAPKPGEQLIFVAGRFELGRRYNMGQSIMFQRGKPNTPYVVKGDAAETMMTSGTLPNAAYDWKNVKLVLPFMPTEVHDQGVLPNGRHLYAYGALQFVPGHERDAYPLDSNSIVMAIDGVSFNAPRAFSSPLEYPAPGQHYLEIIYFQRGDTDGPMRRAYIPVLPKSSVPQWDRMVDGNPMFRSNYAGLVLGALTFVILARALYGITNSSFGRQMHEDYEQCMRARLPTTIC